MNAQSHDLAVEARPGFRMREIPFPGEPLGGIAPGGERDPITVLPDFEAECCKDRNGQDLPLWLLLGPGTEPLIEAFEHWQAAWQVFSLNDLYDRTAPEGGWAAFEARGLALCRRLLDCLGPEGVVIYRADRLSPFHRSGALLLHWEAE